MTDGFVFLVAFLAVLILCGYEHTLARTPYYAQTQPERWKRRALKTAIALLALVAVLTLPVISSDSYAPETDIPYSF